MTPTVRAATSEDTEAILDVARESWYAAYGGFLDPAAIEQTLGETYDADIVAAGIEHDDIAFLVAERDGDVVGFASAERTWADEVELHTIYVHPDCWGEGVGAALFDEIEAWAHKQDVDRIVAAVFSENAVGCGFFEALGFEAGLEANAEVAGRLHPETEFEYHL